MKTKFLLASCVLAAAVTGCQNEEFETVATGGQAASDLVEVGDNFMISGVGAVDPATRTHWVLGDGVLSNAFIPVFATSGAGNSTLSNGTEVLSPTIGACALVGGNVYSNYEFYHYGWLATGQNAADFDVCDAEKLNNGWLYSEVSTTATSTAGNEVAYESGTFKLESTENKTINNQTVSFSEANVNLNSGIYKTENKAMFKGDYVLYYPYNDQFTEGMIPATSDVVFNDVEADDINSLELAENTFRYAYAPDMVGGTTAASFEFKNLSGIVKITVKGANDQNLTNGISKLMLYSEKEGFLTKVYLDPSAVAAGKEGKEIYAKGNEETNKTILVNMESGSELNNGDEIYISALPTTVSDLVVYAYDATDAEWAACEVGNFEIKAGTGVGLEVTYADDDFEPVYLAVDNTTLIEAVKQAKATTPTAQKPATIKVLGNITLDATTNTDGSTHAGRYDIPANVIVTGDEITVPEGTMLVVQSNATMESTVNVEGNSCCGGNVGAGSMVVQKAGTIAGEVNILAGYEAQGKNDGSLTFSTYGTGTTAAQIATTAAVNVEGTVEFQQAVDIRGALNIAEDATATVDGSAADVNVRAGQVNNNGTFEVAEGKFAVLGGNGNSYTAGDGKYFANNGKFIDNVGTTIGGATQYMTMGANAQYICKVNDQARLNEAYERKTACTLIQITAGITSGGSTGGGSSIDYYDFPSVQQHAGKDVDIEVAATGVKFQPSEEVTIGNLSVTEGELTISTTKVTLGNGTKPAVYGYLHVNGDINISASFKTDKDVYGMTADNLTVLDGGTATFDLRENTNEVTLAVEQTIDVQKGGTFTINDASSDNAAYITCREIVENGTFKGYPNVIE